MTNPPLPLPLYLLFVPLFYIPSLHPYFTPYLPPIYIYPPHASPPFDSPSLYSLSILLSTIPLYNPFLQLVVPLVTSQPLHMTNPALMLHLHSPLYILSTSPFYTPFFGTAQFPLGLPPVTRQPPKYHITTFDWHPFETPPKKLFFTSTLKWKWNQK